MLMRHNCPKCENPDAIGYDAIYDCDKPWNYDGIIAWQCKQCGHWYPRATVKEWQDFCDLRNEELEKNEK